MRIDFYYDYVSPFAYIAHRRLTAADIQSTPFPVSAAAVMKLVNNQPSPDCPAKMAYSAFDAARMCRHLKIDFSPNRKFMGAIATSQTDRSLLAAGAHAAMQMGVLDAYDKAIFSAVWAGAPELLDLPGRAAVLNAVGIDGEGLWALAGSVAVVNQLDAANAAAAKRKVFGVPTFFVGDEPFFGNDRLSMALAAAGQETHV